MSTALRAAGHVVVEERRGVDGASRLSSMLAARITPDLLVTDQWMLIGSLREGCACPAVFITTAPNAELDRRARELRVEVLAPPISVEALQQLVSRHVRVRVTA